MDDDYAAAVDDVYEAVELSTSARRRRTVSPVKRRDEPPSPKRGDERNENLIKEARDQLYYSRKARAVSNFKPYTLHEYRKTKPTEYVEFEPLRPNLNEDPALQEKRAKAAKLKAYSQGIGSGSRNWPARSSLIGPGSPLAAAQTADPPRASARVYAQTIPGAVRQKSRRGRCRSIEAAAATGAGRLFSRRTRRGPRRSRTTTADDGVPPQPTRLALTRAAARLGGARGRGGDPGGVWV